MIVWRCPLDVSAYAAVGRNVDPPAVRCPACGGPSGAWSGYERHLRADVLLVIFIPRVRCRSCGRTDALLPWFVLPHRWDTIDVIGAALERHAGGQGMRRIAEAIGRPDTTVREWCRRFGRTAEGLARTLLAAAVERGWSGFGLPVEPGPRVLAAVAALASAWTRRHGPATSWHVAALVTGGSLLATNTGSPLAGGTAVPLMVGSSQPTIGGPSWPPATPPKPSPSGAIT